MMTTLPSWVPAEEGARIHSSNLSLTEGSTFTVIYWCDGKTVAYQFFHDLEKIGDRINLSRAQAMTYGAEADTTGTSELFIISGLSTDAVRSFGCRLWTYGKDGK